MKSLPALSAVPVLLSLVVPATSQAADQLRRGADPVGADTQFHHSDGTQAYGLAQAVFRYSAGEHAVSRIGHMVGLGAVHNWFGDTNPERYRYDVTHWQLPAKTKIHTTTDMKKGCAGKCELGMVKPPAGHILVLTGFVFESLDGSAHNVSTIAIEPNVSTRRIAVEINDGTDFSYGAAVQYAFVPARAVHDGKVITVRKARKNGGRRLKFNLTQFRETRAYLMWQGFRVRFTDGRARPLAQFSLTSGGSAVGVYFHDAAADDKFEATVHVVPGNF